MNTLITLIISLIIIFYLITYLSPLSYEYFNQNQTELIQGEIIPHETTQSTTMMEIKNNTDPLPSEESINDNIETSSPTNFDIPNEEDLLQGMHNLEIASQNKKQNKMITDDTNNDNVVKSGMMMNKNGSMMMTTTQKNNDNTQNENKECSPININISYMGVEPNNMQQKSQAPFVSQNNIPTVQQLASNKPQTLEDIQNRPIFKNSMQIDGTTAISRLGSGPFANPFLENQPLKTNDPLTSITTPEKLPTENSLTVPQLNNPIHNV